MSTPPKDYTPRSEYYTGLNVTKADSRNQGKSPNSSSELQLLARSLVTTPHSLESLLY